MRTLSVLVLLALLPLAATAQEGPPKSIPAQLSAPKQPTSSKVDGLSLPEDMTVSTRQRAVILAADTKAAAVKWIVLNLRGDSPVSFMEVPLAKTLIVFPNDQEDDIVIMAYTAINGQPTDTARTLIRVRPPPPAPPGPAPPGPMPPGPKPPEPPPIPAPIGKDAKLHVTLIIDHTKTTPGVAALENSKPLREVLRAAGHRLHVLDTKQKSIDDADLRGYADKAGSPFVLILQLSAPGTPDNGKVLLAEKLPADDKGVLDAVARVLGGK